ncbi:MAG: hypothetical protein HKN32_04315 [Flavobacteriales bacterium]|nr:hypothetical protein [Flavobacteriales bacterium]
MGVFSKIFNKQKLRDPLDFSVIKTDMHSHLIPAIDDGAKDMQDAIELVRGLQHIGYKKLITTPHVMSDFYRNTSDGIRRGADALASELAREGINIGIHAAAEYYCDEHFENLIEKKDLLTFGDNHILFELPFAAPPSNLKRVIFNLQMAGYKPILAHPERYGYWHNQMDQFRSLVDKDVFLQLNINSISGVYSPAVKKIGMKMMEEGLISYVGTDCHHGGHIGALIESSRIPQFQDYVASDKILNRSL